MTSYLKILFITICIVIGLAFALYPVNAWGSTFALEIMPDYFHEHSFIEALFTMKDLTAGIVIISVVIYGGMKLIG